MMASTTPPHNALAAPISGQLKGMAFQGVAIAKDAWMLGIGSALVLDALTDHLPGR